jgi:hypothetical protein
MRNQHIHTNYRAGDRKSLKAHKRLRFGEQLELDYNHYDFYCFNRRFTYVPAPKAGNDLYVHTKEHGNSEVTSLADPEAQGTVLAIYSHGYDKDKKYRYYYDHNGQDHYWAHRQIKTARQGFGSPSYARFSAEKRQDFISQLAYERELELAPDDAIVCYL